VSHPEQERAVSVDEFRPVRPTLLATGFFSLWVAILSLPMLTGKFVAGPWSDQYATGYAFRAWAAEQWRSTGRVPLWNPEIFGGMPFVAGMHGDIFYPTAWLRLVLPIDVAMNLGFVVHYVLAGLFTYLLLRALRVSWTGSVVGGLAYQLSGLVASYVNPGHDGKLFVTALFPLALLALVWALRDRRWEGLPLFALVTGLGVLSPHPQLLYYMLVAAGLFALYLTFGEPTDSPLNRRLVRLAGALAAVVVGVLMIGAIQIGPFWYYIPFSPRAETYGGWERATSFAIPWDHIPEFFLAKFTGVSSEQTYWGGNGFKLHSEYLGLPVVVLAVLGSADRARRRLILWLGAIGTLFLLVSLGAATPFYRMWYEVMPFMKQVRAPGMAFYIVAFVVAVLAAFGGQRLARREGGAHVTVWFWAASVVAVLALVGGIGWIAEGLASGIQQQTGRPTLAVAASASSSIQLGALGSAVFLAGLVLVAWGFLREKIGSRALALLIILVVGTDLWINARTFWNYSNAPDDLFGGDAITEYLQQVEPPFRVLDLQVYPPGGSTSTLMAYGIPQLLGHHGNELHAFDQLMGGKNVWSNLPFWGRGDLKLLDLYAVRYLIVPGGQGLDSLPGFRRLLAEVPTAGGGTGILFERVPVPQYARFVSGAVKEADSLATAMVLHPQFMVDRLVYLDATFDGQPEELTAMPEPADATVDVAEWAPGRMRLNISPAAPVEGYVVISENWYFDWRATVDGQPVDAVRGNGALITVPVAAGARDIELAFESDHYRAAKLITLGSLLAVTIAGIAPPVVRRKRRV
jgi:hypothetical protein